MDNNDIFDKSSLTKEEAEFFENRKLKDKIFIGCFNKTKSGYQISDIRRSDFSKIKYKPQRAKTFTISIEGPLKGNIKDGQYYKFTWVMLKSKPSYIFGIDEHMSIEPVKPHDIVDLLYDDIYNYPASASEKIVNSLDTLKNQLTASGKEVFIYELLQNANDYPQVKNGRKQPVDVEFHITDNYLIFQHSGEYFDARNIAAICSINDKEKADKSEAIGYKGIGFKTVFLDNNYVLLKTGEYSFRFDYEYTKSIDDTPWQILPVWTDDDEIDSEVLDVTNKADKKFRVQIALRPTDSETLHDVEQNYEELFENVFETERVILFIPYINSVSVYMDGEEEPSIVQVKDSVRWCVSEAKKYVSDVPEDLTLELNRRINKNDGKIPEKYYDFTKTSVSFACKRDGKKLLPVENTCLYCYLPAKKAKFGFGFLMNSDMIPNGSRDNIEPKEKINHVIAKIAGKLFFQWIQDLLNSQKYDYDSIFGLIPNFENCKKRYEDDEDVSLFIEEFQEGFEGELKEGLIIPVEENGQMVLKPIGEVNYDVTGITCTDLMTDDEVRSNMEWRDFFPHKDLRDYENHCLKPGIYSFLGTYVLDGFTLDFDEIKYECESDSFQNWLLGIEHNNEFIDFLLGKGRLNNFKDTSIFITEDGTLEPANSIYENIDDIYPDLAAFNDYLPRLSRATRDYFEEREDWQAIKERLFKSFNAKRFVDVELMPKNNLEDTIKRLRDKQASLGFYNFLARHVDYRSTYDVLPIISFIDNQVIDNFKGNVYLYSEEGAKLYNEEWVDKEWFNLISDDYSEEAKAYFYEYFGVPDFSIEDFIDNILLSDNAISYLNDLGYEHKSFVKYCFEHKEYFGDKGLSDFSLWTYDKEGDNHQTLCEDIIYFESELLDKYQEKSWIENEWMYSLDEEYFDVIDDKKAFQTFLSDKFGVRTFTMKSFYEDVVAPHTKEICDNVGCRGSEIGLPESVDLLYYLGENHKLIFDDHGDYGFIDLPLYRYDTWDAITNREVNVYLYNDELESILDSNWMPDDVVYMLDKEYDEVLKKHPILVKKLELNKYTFKNLKDSLFAEISLLEKSAWEKEQNVAFHRFMIENKKDLTEADYKSISNIGVYAVDINGTEELYPLEGAIYLSDKYMEQGKGIESTVKEYDESACFVSEDYLPDDGAIGVEIWHNYFVSIGVRVNIRDIVFLSVIPNLSVIKNKDIVSLLADYYDEFHKDNTWDEIKDDLCYLNVATKAGDEVFKPISEVLFNDCYEPDPYPYIVIEDEIADSYRKASPEAIRLLREIVRESGANSFDSLDEWKGEKLDQYLLMQEEDEDKIRPIHVQFIQDLAKDYNLHSDLYPRVKIKEIKMLSKDGSFHNPDQLTEGTAYGPRCDFERFNIPLSYLSEEYLQRENTDKRTYSKLLRDMDVVYDIHKEHFPLMKDNYEFTLYFWTEYLLEYSNRTHITSVGIGELDKVATIPTGNAERKEVKKPSQLYSPTLIQDGFVDGKIRDCKDKMPLEDIFSTQEVKERVLAELSFAKKLSFNDCLDCLLTVKITTKRLSVLAWLASYEEINLEAVSEYLNHKESVWRNGRGEFVKLNDLYVIDPDEDRLIQLFGKNAKVMSQEYFSDDDAMVCFRDIFNIDPLTQDDFTLSFQTRKEATTEIMRKKLRLPLLIVAAVSNPSDWKELYEDYCSKIDALSFHKCNSIILNYNEDLKDSSIQYHKVDSDIYFVKDWMGRRVFKDIVADIQDYLGIDMDENILEGIFEADDANQKEIIDRHVNYEVIKENAFRECLRSLNADIAMGVQPFVQPDEEESSEEPFVFGRPTKKEKMDVPIEPTPIIGDNEEDHHDDEEDEDMPIDTNSGDGIDDESEDNTDYEKDDEPPIDSEETDEEDSEDCNELTDSDTSHEPPRHKLKSQGNPDSGRSTNPNYWEGLPGKRVPTIPETQTGNVPEKPYEGTGKQGVTSGRTHKRDNYMGYDPDRTSHRQFNVGRQEPTTLETKEATDEEISRLSALLGRAFDRDSIVDENYLVRMRFYNSVKKTIGDLEMSEKEFISKGRKYVKTKSGKYVHRCSARGGILYVSPRIWNSLRYDNCIICMYYGRKANQFLYIRSQRELMQMIDRDAVLIQITGDDKGLFINELYANKFPNMQSNIYTMIRTIKTLGDDFIFEPSNTNPNYDNNYDPDAV